MTQVVAIDLGASNGRLMLGTLAGKELTLEEIHRFPNEPITKDGHLYWDLQKIKDEMIKGLLKCQGRDHTSIQGIGIDTWGVDFGFLSAEGELLENPYNYRDTHTNEMMDEVHQKISPKDLFQQTGVEPAAINTLYQLAAIQAKRPELIEEAQTILTMPSLVGYLLTGEAANEFTHASTTQLLHLHTGNWNTSLMEKVYGHVLPMAPIQPTHTILGHITAKIQQQTNLKSIPVIHVPGHDTACAVAAMPLKSDDTVFMSCGTWVLIGIKVEKPIVSDEAYQAGFTNEGTAEGTYRFQKNNMGLWLLQQCKREWEEQGEIISYEEESRLLEEAEPFQAWIDPDDERFFNPESMIQAIQTYCKETGQKVPERKGAILRLIIESLALKYRWILEQIEQLTKKTVPSIHMVGGAIQNEHFSQFTANATKKEVLAGPIEASATGNALSQLFALGKISSVKEAEEISKNSFPMRTFLPEEEGLWDEAYERFTKIINVTQTPT